MTRLLVATMCVVFACVLAGIFGAAHDQVSFTVSPKYFFHLKFDQFGIAPGFHNRLGAAFVGWYASWWMGLFIGIPVALVSLLMPSTRLQFKAFAWVAVLIVLCTLAAALFSLTLTPPREIFEHIRISDRVQDVEAYVRVGFMHSVSYLAGAASTVLGLIILAIWVWRARRT